MMNPKALAWYANLLFKSGLFPDIKRPEEIAVKIVLGEAYGLNPVQAQMAFDVIEGRLSPNASFTSALLRKSNYDYHIEQLDNVSAVLSFWRDGKKIGTSAFTVTDAERARLLGRKSQNYEKYPRNMLFARALTNGVAWYAPDVFMIRPYNAEELLESGAPDPTLNQLVEAEMKSSNGERGSTEERQSEPSSEIVQPPMAEEQPQIEAPAEDLKAPPEPSEPSNGQKVITLDEAREIHRTWWKTATRYGIGRNVAQHQSKESDDETTLLEKARALEKAVRAHEAGRASMNAQPESESERPSSELVSMVITNEGQLYVAANRLTNNHYRNVFQMRNALSLKGKIEGDAETMQKYLNNLVDRVNAEQAA